MAKRETGADDEARASGGGSDPLADVDLEVLSLSPAERRERDVAPEEVREAFRAVAVHGDRELKRLGDVTLPGVALGYAVVGGADNHPIDLRGATLEGPIEAEHAEIRVPVLLDGAELAGIDLDEAHVAGKLSARDATVTGEVSAFEARFDDDVDLSGATFSGAVTLDEAVFDDDVTVDDARFSADVRARGAEFHGDSNLLEDNTSFADATFGGALDCTQAEFGFVHFEDAAFEGPATFREAKFTGDADVRRATFADEADFDETDFTEDAFFDGARFAADASFRGAEFEGGARTTQDDASFADVTFAGAVTFRRAAFRAASFPAAAFEATAGFEEAVFDGDADFPEATFAGEADFDEARFRADADFSGARFESACVFRGAEFLGDANHLEDNATFADAAFAAAADFDEARFTSANFSGTRFGDEVDFSGVWVRDRIDFHAVATDDDAVVDFTDASVPEGEIVQPAEGWVYYDLTAASVGDVVLSTADGEDRGELLDHFRFCDTEFTEFDGREFNFGAHTDYLDRNGWVLHAFPGAPADHEVAVEATPAVTEQTYLKAKQCASAAGNAKAAGEFRVKRQTFARRKNAAVVRDPDVAPVARVRAASRVAENLFLGVTCGHGMRLLRIAAVFALAPLVPALLYAFGGPLFATSAGQLSSLGGLASPAGRRILFENVYFSYISYTTIGYGGIGPTGALARVLAASEAYLSTILAALVVYALVKRSEL